MPIPKFDELFNDVLDLLSDENEYRTRDVKEIISNKLDLTDEERQQLLPSKQETIIKNRIGWSITSLKKAGYVESQKWGSVNITELGLKEYSKNQNITLEDLIKIPEYNEWLNPSAKPKEEKTIPCESTPEEEMEKSFAQINDSLSDLIIENILNNTPIFFERLVVDLLLKMGYGEFRPDAGMVTSPVNDGGIDGIINEDRLGINKIAIQAKRFSKGNVIGRPEIQKFAGALHEKGLTKGVFITTSSFTKEAVKSAKNQSIVLIDGDKLADLMIEYNVGTYTIHTYEIKKIDSDYFNIGE